MIKTELNKRNLKPRDIYYLFKNHLKIEMSERSFYNHIDDDFKRCVDEDVYKRKIKCILSEYDEFLNRIVC